jgi:HAE1 family hydrophobic/amphiphilic exporter-1
MQGIEYVRSTSLNEHSEILIKFIDDLDYDALYDELRLRVMSVQNSLPVINGDPLLPAFRMTEVDEWLPVIQVNLLHKDGISGSKRSLLLMAKDLRARLETIENIKEVRLLGEDLEQYNLSLDPEKLERYGVLISEVSSRLNQSGKLIPGGSMRSGDGEKFVLLDDIAKKPDELYEMVIRQEGSGGSLRLSELLDWENTGIQRMRSGIISSINGKDSISCKVLKLPMGNADTVKEAVVREVEQFLKDLGDESVTYNLSLDSTIMIKDSLGILQQSLYAACILVVLALFWFLTHASKTVMWLGTLLGAITGLVFILIPVVQVKMAVLAAFMLYVFGASRAAILTVGGIVFSFIGSLIVFYLMGISLNEITLLGFVLTVGIIVDDAIVVLENIRRHRELGLPMSEAAIKGTSEVFWPVVSATLTTMAAFLPMLLMTGSTGEFFSLVPIAVSIALTISLFECLLILPLHAVELQRLLGSEKVEPHKEDHYQSFLAREGFLGILHRNYDRMLKTCLKHPFVACSIIALLFLTSVGLLGMSIPENAQALGIRPPLKLEFFPDDPSQCWITLRMPEGSSLQKTDIKAREVSKFIADQGTGYIRSVSSLAGMSLDMGFKPVRGNNFAFLQVELANSEEKVFKDGIAYIQTLRQLLEQKFEIDGLQLNIQAMQGGPPTGSPVNVRVFGMNEKNVVKMTQDLFAWMQEQSVEGGKLEGVMDLSHNREQKIRQYKFEINDQEVTKYGLTTLQVQQHVSTLFEGAYVGDYRRSDKDIPIKLRMSPNHHDHPERMLNYPIFKFGQNNEVRYADLGKLEYREKPDRLMRRDFIRTIVINGGLHENAIYSPAPIAEWYKEHGEQYPGVSIDFGGEEESTRRSYQSLLLAFLLATFLIYGILAAQFKSYMQPMIIMSNIMFALIGVVIVMSIFGVMAQVLGPSVVRPERAWFTVQCFMAVVGLSGLVVNDAIVLIDFINQRRAQGLPVKEALLMAGHQRMRPILMTTITTIAGLLPMSIGLPEFNMNWSPFATAFVAGLTVSTMMTLLIIPVLYELVYDFTKFTTRHSHKVFKGLRESASSESRQSS